MVLIVGEAKNWQPVDSTQFSLVAPCRPPLSRALNPYSASGIGEGDAQRLRLNQGRRVRTAFSLKAVPPGRPDSRGIVG